MRTARAKGASEAVILRSHILRNASLPIVTMLAMDLGVWLVSAIFVERVYGLPGLGSLFAASVRRNDLPVVLAIFVLISLTIVIFNLIVDIVYAKLDPRVSLQATDHEGTVVRESRRGSAALRKRHRRRSLRRQPVRPGPLVVRARASARRLSRALRRPRRESRSGARARCTARRSRSCRRRSAWRPRRGPPAAPRARPARARRRGTGPHQGAQKSTITGRSDLEHFGLEIRVRDLAHAVKATGAQRERGHAGRAPSRPPRGRSPCSSSSRRPRGRRT